MPRLAQPLLRVLLPALGALLGCAGGPPAGAARGAGEGTASASASTDAPADYRRKPDPRRHMQANFWVAVELRDALVEGDLAQARSLADWLSTRELQRELPAQWRPWVEDMRRSAAEISAAPDGAAAARALGGLAMSCGGCHWNFGARALSEPEQDDQGFPPEGPEDVQTRMLRHEWAADEMWYGLTIPSDAAWKRGARVLIESPFAPPEQHELPISPELARGIEAMREFGESAQHTDTMPDRARLYARLLTSCADCHGKQ